MTGPAMPAPAMAGAAMTGVPEVVEKFRAAGSELAKDGESDLAVAWPRIARLGIFELGRSSEAVAAIEGLGLGGLPAGWVYAVASQLFGILTPLRRLLGDHQRHLLDGVESGEVLLCHASTEEGGGSDPLGITTRADRRADGRYLLNGRKSFITAAPLAGQALVFARTVPGRSPFALSAFLVPLAGAGVTRSAPLAKSALREVPMGVLDFTDVELSPDRLVAAEGAGLSVLATTTAWERALLLSYALGTMRRLLDRTVDWARTREQFGRRLGASQLAAARIADMALRVHRSRELVYGLAARLDAGVPMRSLTAEAAMVKVSVTEDHAALTQSAAGLAGVRAYLEDSELFADPATALAGLTYAGPNDLLRLTVARELGLPVGN
ncbi:acyl-CoA dehydrogenase [Actinoplanes sp. NPDC051470]|uniref:acyl-CoA dehydrogenase family protein n=1 Tax=Actinoplanes sp. NPDC051470 TaxID=3157224 RepID=UPI00341E6CB3